MFESFVESLVDHWGERRLPDSLIYLLEICVLQVFDYEKGLQNLRGSYFGSGLPWVGCEVD